MGGKDCRIIKLNLADDISSLVAPPYGNNSPALDMTSFFQWI